MANPEVCWAKMPEDPNLEDKPSPLTNHGRFRDPRIGSLVMCSWINGGSTIPPEKPTYPYPYPFFVGGKSWLTFQGGRRFHFICCFHLAPPVWSHVLSMRFFDFFGFVRERLRFEKMGVKCWVWWNFEYPHAPCMEYLPTFIIGSKPNVGTYFIKHLGYVLLTMPYFSKILQIPCEDR